MSAVAIDKVMFRNFRIIDIKVPHVKTDICVSDCFLLCTTFFVLIRSTSWCKHAIDCKTHTHTKELAKTVLFRVHWLTSHALGMGPFSGVDLWSVPPMLIELLNRDINDK